MKASGLERRSSTGLGKTGTHLEGTQVVTHIYWDAAQYRAITLWKPRLDLLTNLSRGSWGGDGQLWLTMQARTLEAEAPENTALRELS